MATYYPLIEYDMSLRMKDGKIEKLIFFFFQILFLIIAITIIFRLFEEDFSYIE